MIRTCLSLLLVVFIMSHNSSSADDPIEVQTPVTGYMGVTGTVDLIEDFQAGDLKSRHLEIWLPPSYAKDSSKRYPVLYMHDGQNLFDPERANFGVDWGIDEAMTRLIAEGVVREAIVVGNWSTPDRFSEYMPQGAVNVDTIEKYRKTHPNLGWDAVKSDQYLEFLVDRLKPWIDENYRTLQGKDNSFIMGSSMGGLISAYAISKYPDVFGAAACVSTHTPLGDGLIVEYLGSNLPDPSSHRIYFDYGTETLDHNYEGYQKRLDAIGYARGYVEGENWRSLKFEGHEHSERAWRARVHIPLIFLLGKTASE